MSNEQFKDRLIATRESKGLSQTRLAALSGMAPTQLARYETGKAVPRRASMMRLAEALGVQPDWLMRGETVSWPAPISMQVRSVGDEAPPEELVIPPIYVDFVRGVAERLGGSVSDAIVEIIKRYMVEIALAPTGHPKIPHLGALVTEYTDLELRVESLAAELAALKKDAATAAQGQLPGQALKPAKPPKG